MIAVRITAGAVLLAATSAGAGAGMLTVEVTEVASSRGVVRVAVCTRDTFLEPACPYTGSAAAREGLTVVRVDAVPPGRYALQAFHDANANHRIDRNFLGLPEEGIGFGNDAAIRFGPPEFTEASVDLPDAATWTSLRLRYLAGR